MICSGLILFVPLICIGATTTQKVGARIINYVELSIQNIQNLSFGVIRTTCNGYSSAVRSVTVTASGETILSEGEAPAIKSVSGGHHGTIKITGLGTVAISSTPPSALIHTTDSTKGLSLRNMKIVNSDGSAISNMNNVEINGNLELKTVGTVAIGPNSCYTGEYTADWTISVIYSGVYADGADYEP